MKTWLSLVFLISLSFTDRHQDPRKENFPEEILYVKNMPAPENLWVFIMAGQSNMAGRGFVEPQDTIPNKRILSIDKSGNWIYAKEPLHFYEPKLAGLDCGMAFANRLLDSVPENISVAMIPCAVGGSSIEQWLRDDTFRGVSLFTNFSEKVKLTQKYSKIKAILWHQGESDAHPKTIPDYADNLDSLVSKFRETVEDKNLPVLIGELGKFGEPLQNQINRESINLLIHTFSDETTDIYVINTSDLEHKGDHVHFNSDSQRKMGERFAKEYLQSIYSKL